MADIEKVKQGLKFHGSGCCNENGMGSICPYWKYVTSRSGCSYILAYDALSVIEELQKDNKALRLLVEWATECDFGFDQFYGEYRKYKDEIKDMGYIDGMIHVAKRTIEDGDRNG